MAKQVLRKSTAGANSAAMLSNNDRLMLGRQPHQAGWDVIRFDGSVGEGFVFEYEPTKSGRRTLRRQLKKAMATEKVEDIARVLRTMEKYKEAVDIIEPPVQVLPGYDNEGTPKSKSKKRSKYGAKKRNRQLVSDQPEDSQKQASTEHSQATLVQRAAIGMSMGERNDTSVNADTTRGREFNIEYTCEHMKTFKRRVAIASFGPSRDRHILLSKQVVEYKQVCLETATNKKRWRGKIQWLCSRHGQVRTHTAREQAALKREKKLWS